MKQNVARVRLEGIIGLPWLNWVWGTRVANCLSFVNLSKDTTGLIVLIVNIVEHSHYGKAHEPTI